MGRNFKVDDPSDMLIMIAAADPIDAEPDLSPVQAPTLVQGASSRRSDPRSGAPHSRHPRTGRPSGRCPDVVEPTVEDPVQLLADVKECLSIAGLPRGLAGCGHQVVPQCDPDDATCEVLSGLRGFAEGF